MAKLAIIEDAAKEATALEALLADCRDMIAADPDLVLDLAEGQTNALEVIDALVIADGFDAELIKGAKDAKAIIDYRLKRFEARSESRRAIIERFLLIMDLKKLERAAATISLADRAPKVQVTDESAIPAKFFKSVPTLDKKALNEAVAAIVVANATEADVAKAEGREAALLPYPDGIALSNGSVGLTIRRR